MDMLKSTRKKNNLLLHLPTNLTLKLPHIPDRLALFAVRQRPRLVVLAKPARPARTPLVVAHSHDSVGALPVFVGICGRRVGRVAGDLSTSVTGAVGRRERAGCVEVVADMPCPTSQGGGVAFCAFWADYLVAKMWVRCSASSTIFRIVFLPIFSMVGGRALVGRGFEMVLGGTRLIYAMVVCVIAPLDQEHVEGYRSRR
jgi:hypothetical protein